MKALTLQEGKIYLVPDVPEKAMLNDRSNPWYKETGGYLHPDTWYKRKMYQALSNKIEVAEKSREFALNLMAQIPARIEEGELYPIEGLEYEVVHWIDAEFNNGGIVKMIAEGVNICTVEDPDTGARWETMKRRVKQLAVLTYKNGEAIDATKQPIEK